MAAIHASPIQFGVTAAVVTLAIVLRMRRMGRARPLRAERLWIVPAIFTGVTALVLWQMPPSWNDLPWLIGAAVIGGAIGWYRGKMMRITVDPETHALNQAASPWAMLFLLALIGVRYAARYFLTEEAENWHIGLNVLTDAPLLLAAAMLSASRIEMYLRAQALLKQARAKRDTSSEA